MRKIVLWEVVLLGCFFVIHAAAQQPSKQTIPGGPTHTKKTVLNLHNYARSVTVQVEVQGKDGSLGSGVWVSKDGYVATCWHVVRSSPGNIQVKFAYPNVYDLDRNIIQDSSFSVALATVVAKDEMADVAILKVSPNPLVSPPPIQRLTPLQPQMKLAVAMLQTKLPNPGDFVLLAGYPFGHPDLLSQEGTVSTVAIADEVPISDSAKKVRILLSLVANPGNSGGPVFDSFGNIIGLLSAYQPWPTKTPIRDAEGNTIDFADNRDVWQNSGISVVVPAHFLKAVLDQAEGKSPSSPSQTGSVIIRGTAVINAPPDTEPKTRSSLTNSELKVQNVAFVARFRELLNQQEQRQELESLRMEGASGVGLTRKERQRAWEKAAQESLPVEEEMRQEYKDNFREEAIRLRDDLWARLPVSVRDPRSARLYTYGLDLVERRHVADDLERLSRLLPD